MLPITRSLSFLFPSVLSAQHDPTLEPESLTAEEATLCLFPAYRASSPLSQHGREQRNRVADWAQRDDVAGSRFRFLYRYLAWVAFITKLLWTFLKSSDSCMYSVRPRLQYIYTHVCTHNQELTTKSNDSNWKMLCLFVSELPKLTHFMKFYPRARSLWYKFGDSHQSGSWGARCYYFCSPPSRDNS